MHRAAGAGDRLLGGLLRRGHHREATHPGSLEPLPLGDQTLSATMTYCRSLLTYVFPFENGEVAEISTGEPLEERNP